MARSSKGGGGMLQWLGLAFILLLADQFTKVLIVGYYHLGDSTTVTNFNIAGPQQRRSLLSGGCVGLAALVLHGAGVCGGRCNYLDAEIPPRPEAIQLCHGLHTGRRRGQCN